MIYRVFSFVFLCSVFVSSSSAVEDNKKVKAFKCKSEYVGIWDIEVTNIGPDRYYDRHGKQADRLLHGMVELFVTEEEIVLDEATIVAVGHTLDEMDQWKKPNLAPSEGPVVGLHVETTDFLIFYQNSWVLLRFHHLNRNFIQIFEARIAIEREEVKVFSRVPSKVPTLSEDKKIIDIFWKLKTISNNSKQ